MSKEVIAKICKACERLSACSFINKDLQDYCPIVQQSLSGYYIGYGDAVIKAGEWLVDNAHHYHDINGDYDVFEMVKQLEKAIIHDTLPQNKPLFTLREIKGGAAAK